MTLQDQLQATLGSGFTVTRELGGGGMSRVFVAHDGTLNRDVAVKVLPQELAAGVNVDRFRREILLAAALQHPNIVPVLAAGDTDGLPYYTMPFVAGESLRARLARGPLPMTIAVSLLREVARALSYAHARGIVHRDIKPDNILISGGSAVVADFGIAKAISASRTIAPGATLTQIGTSIGTPAYMAPEQAAGDPDTDHRADLYAFGCVAYELLAGRPPFVEKSPHKLLTAHMTETPPSVATFRADVPPVLAELIASLLAKSPDERPRSAEDVIHVLDSAVSSSSTPAAPAVLLGGAGMFRRALLWYAAAFVVVAIVAKAAIVGIGLPDWVFSGALIVMALGLPIILFTGYSHYAARRAFTITPTFTPGGTPSIAQGTMATIAVKASPHLSWRRTFLGGGIAVGAFVFAIGGYMVLRALGIGPAASLLASGRLNQRDQLIVADIESRGTADSTLGRAISEAVRADLGQSNVVRLMPPTAIAAALVRMQKPATTRLDVATAREIGRRDGAKAVIAGEIGSAGSGYLITLRVVSSDSGATLATFQQTADGTRDLLESIGKLTREMRGKLGESLKLVQNSPPLEQVTTANFEALRLFAAASRANNIEGKFEESVELHRQALGLDSTFASAWRALAVALRNAGHPRSEADSASARAFRYRERLPIREQLLVEAEYWGNAGRDRAKAARAFERMLIRDSTDATALNNLGLIEGDRRHFARAETLFKKAYATVPGATVLANHARALLAAGRTEEAHKEALAANGFRGGTGPISLVQVLYVEGKIDSARQVAEAAARSSTGGVKENALGYLRDIAQVRGRLDEARNHATAIYEDAVANRLAGTPFDVPRIAAVQVGWLGERPDQGAAILDSTLARHPLSSMPIDQRPYLPVAQTYALIGRPDRARAVLTQWDAEVRDTSLRRASEPQRHLTLAQIALAERRARDAVAETKLAEMLPDGTVSPCAGCYQLLLGRAYDLGGQPDSAIVALERYLSEPSWARVGQDATMLAWTYKRLGELYEAKRETEKAASNYTKFVALWEKADPMLQPKVAEAKQRLRVLGVSEKR